MERRMHGKPLRASFGALKLILFGTRFGIFLKVGICLQDMTPSSRNTAAEHISPRLSRSSVSLHPKSCRAAKPAISSLQTPVNCFGRPS